MRLILLGLLALLSLAARANEPLPPELAFVPSAQLIDSQHVELRWRIAPGYYLYRDRISASQGLTPLALPLPNGERKDDPTFGVTQVFHQQLVVTAQSPVPLTPEQSVTVNFQGCSDQGLCYPPQQVTLPLDGSSRQTGLDRWLSNPASDEEQDRWFAGSYPATWLLFYLAGLGLAFTACLYPLIPIVSALILGRPQQSRARALLLTLCYLQGLALAYTLFGLLAASTGTLLSVTLQQPAVIAAFAIFFVLMALAMAGVFQLQMPGALQGRITMLAQRLPGGAFVPVFVSGMLSAILVGPCMAPPLAAALAYLGQQGDLWLGGSALYMLALGTGTPLLAVALLGSQILPRLQGRIMRLIRYAFAAVMLGMAVWIAQPLWHHWFNDSSKAQQGAHFITVRNLAELDAQLAASQRPVLVDVYADWCRSCIEFEQTVLPRPEVQAALQGLTLIRADITANDRAAQALLRRYGLFGPPALLRFAPGQKQPELRLIGLQDAATLVTRLQTPSSTSVPVKP